MSPLNAGTIGSYAGTPPVGWVQIRTTDGRAAIVALIGTTNPDVTDGRGGWSEVQRPRQPSVIEWTGPALLKATLPILLDAWAEGGDISAHLNLIDTLSPVNPTTEPPAVYVTGGWPIPPNVPFVVQSITWGDRILDGEGRVCRAELSLELMQQSFANVVIRTSPAKDAVKKKTGKTPSVSRSKPRSVTVRKGDTLAALAAKYLGSASKWTVLRDLNKLRDPNHLKAGQVIKLS